MLLLTYTTYIGLALFSFLAEKSGSGEGVGAKLFHLTGALFCFYIETTVVFF